MLFTFYYVLVRNDEIKMFNQNKSIIRHVKCQIFLYVQFILFHFLAISRINMCRRSKWLWIRQSKDRVKRWKYKWNKKPK